MLKSCEVCLDRLKLAEAKDSLNGERLAAKDAIIAAKDGQIEQLKQQVADLREANKARAGANTIDAYRAENLQQQLDAANARIHQLEHPGFFASVFDRRTLGGLVAGYAGCRIGAK